MTPPTDLPWSTLEVEDDLDIFALGRVWDRLQSFVATTSGDVVLDLTAVQDLDLSGMQALLLLDRACAAHGARLRVLGLAPDHGKRMAALGFPPLNLLERPASAR